MDKRNERMLEEVLRHPGNETCADCHAPAPRWASVNLGIFLCVACASVHRKLGTHKSRVKSVTLDTWSRDQIKTMQTIGNTLSNSTFNPNETANPPPNTTGSDERDSDLEKYIRRKYELGSYKSGVRVGAGGGGGAGLTSLGRARGVVGNGRELGNGYREGEGRSSANGNGVRENARNPELNGIVSVKREGGNVRDPGSVVGSGRDRDLPALPVEAGGPVPVSRLRPAPKAPGPVWATAKPEEAKLIDFGGDENGGPSTGNGNGAGGHGGSSSSSRSGNASNGMAWATTHPQAAVAGNGYGQTLFNSSTSYQNAQAGPSFSQPSSFMPTAQQNQSTQQNALQHFAPYNHQQPIQSQSLPQQYAQHPYNPFQQQQQQQHHIYPSSYTQNTLPIFMQPQPQQSFLQPNNTSFTPTQQGQQYFAAPQGQGMSGALGGAYAGQQGGQQRGGMGMGMGTGVGTNMTGYGQGFR